MEYRIINDSCISKKSERTRCKKIIQKQIERLERLNSSYPKNLVVNIFFKKPDKLNYLISAFVRLRHDIVLINHTGQNLEAGIYLLFDRLRIALSKKLNKSRKEQIRHKRNIHTRSFCDNLPDLLELKGQGSDNLLKDLLVLLINDLAKYIRRRLKLAKMTSAVAKGKFKIQELLDDIYLIIHDRLDEIPKNDVESTLWLYRVADEYLADKFQELEFEKENFERIDNIVENEYKSLEEKYTVDAEFEIIPLEELDEYESHGVVYSVNDLQYNDEEENLLDDLILRLNEKDIHEIIEKELAKLPFFKRTIMDLYLVDQMTIQEISRIKDVSELAVEAVIREVNNQLKKKLSSLL